MQDRAAQSLTALLRRFATEVDANAVAVLWDGTEVPLGTSNHPGEALRVQFSDPNAISYFVRRPSLDRLFEVVARGGIGIEGMSPLEATAHWKHLKVVDFARSVGVLGFVRALWPFLRRTEHSPDGSLEFGGGDDAAQVRHHYDVSNDFYRLFLDDRMVYSCGYFEDDDTDLNEAQRAKLDLVCRKLRLREGERLLDIGCGWGGMAIHAAQNYGVRVLGITLAKEQYDLARQRVAEAGLADRIDIELRDWRDVNETGAFDAVVQIGMYEHVDRADQTEFFAAVHRMLRPTGRYLHHAIVRRHKGKRRRKSAYLKVINRFVFPGTELDHIGRTLMLMERTGFEPHDTENLRWHYARTCRVWSERLYERRTEAAEIVGDDVTRMWLLYLAMVTLGFERSILGIHQTLCTRRAHGAPPVPATRDDIYENG